MTDAIPQQRADRHQLQEIIAGLTEGVILIDPDRTIAWANEAALAMHGVETLDALGATVSDYRARFQLRYRNYRRLAAGDYPMDRVLAGEAFRDVIVEVAPAGEDEPRWVHRIRSLVLTDADGEPDCLVLVLHDATERFDAEERFEQAFAANPAPAIICRIADLRYVKVNQGFLEMTGYTREDVIGHSVYEIDVLERADKRELAIERLNDGQTIPQMEAVLRLPGDETKFVIVAGQPIEIGDEACMLFTFVDLEPRKKAEDALRQSEERFSKAFRLAPVPMTLSTLDSFCLFDVNDAFLATSGYVAEEVIGRTAREIELWRPSSAQRSLEQQLERSGSVRNVEIQLRTKAGDCLDCLVSAETVTIQDQLCILSVVQDITERKRTEVELVAAIEAVMHDTSWFSRTVLEKLATLRHPQGAGQGTVRLDALTARERSILGLLCQGLADKEIAQRLGLSGSTVRNRISALYHKIGVSRRSAAVAWARDRGFTGETVPKDRSHEG
jgi:PAS domain S-box-containing protein